MAPQMRTVGNRQGATNSVLNAGYRLEDKKRRQRGVVAFLNIDYSFVPK